MVWLGQSAGVSRSKKRQQPDLKCPFWPNGDQGRKFLLWTGVYFVIGEIFCHATAIGVHEHVGRSLEQTFPSLGVPHWRELVFPTINAADPASMPPN